MRGRYRPPTPQTTTPAPTWPMTPQPQLERETTPHHQHKPRHKHRGRPHRQPLETLNVRSSIDQLTEDWDALEQSTASSPRERPTWAVGAQACGAVPCVSFLGVPAPTPTGEGWASR